MITLDQPAILESPETAAKTFPSAWVTELSIVSDPTGKTALHAVFHPWNPQTNELAPRPDWARRMVILDVFAAAAADPVFGEAIDALLPELGRQAKLRGII